MNTFRGMEDGASVWISNYIELEKEITRFCHDLSTSSQNKQKVTNNPGSIADLKAMLEETKAHVLARFQQIEVKDRWELKLDTLLTIFNHSLLLVKERFFKL